MARDAIARLDDVNMNSVLRDYEKKVVRFEANTGRSIDLKKLHGALKDTRLAGKTGSVIHYLELTVVGKAERSGADVLWLVSGSKQEFKLGAEEMLKPEPTKTLADLQGALQRGQTVVSVTGRVRGWSGRYPDVLAKYPPGEMPADSRPVLIVTDFQTDGK